jgi:hypothetical protein
VNLALNDASLLLASLIYVIPIVLLGLLLARCRRGRPWLTATLLVALPAFYVSQFLTLRGTQGWPSAAELPARFTLEGFKINEPGPGNTELGSILLWVTAEGVPVPRVHRLPYDRGLHESLTVAGEKIRTGTTQVGTRTDTPPSGDGSGLPADIRFEDARPAGLPAKNTGE